MGLNVNNTTKGLVAKVPLRGLKQEDGGVGVFLSFDMLKEQLVAMQEMNTTNIFSQIDIYENGIVLLYEGDEDNIKLIEGRA